MTTARRAVLEARLSRSEAESRAAREALRLRTQERQTLDTARAQLARAHAALAAARTARDQAALQFARTEIIAPPSLGNTIVLARLIEPGTRLMTSDDMNASLAFRLYDPARLQIRVDVPLADALRIIAGQEAIITTEAAPDRTFSGHISRIVHEANIQKNTVQVKVQVTPPADPSAIGILKPEMLTRVRFAGGPAPRPHSSAADVTETTAPAGHIMLAPRLALVNHDGDSAQVWVVDQARTAATLREVRLAPPAPTASPTSQGNGDYVEIASGLRPGDRVIVQPPVPPARGLREGARIRSRPWASAEGGAAWR
jgi:HlyD family secretion protein